MGKNSVSQSTSNTSLDNSVLYEEQKGNYIQEAQALKAKPEATTAEAIFEHGKNLLLAGKIRAAEAAFQASDNAPDSNANLRLRSRAVQNLAAYWQYNLYPDWAGAYSAEISYRWNGEDFLKKVQPIGQALFKQATDKSSKAEYILINHFLTGLYSQRVILHANSMQSRTLPPESLDTFLDSVQSDLADLQYYESPPAWQAFIHWSCADLCKRANRADKGLVFLHNARDIYKQTQDAAGQAICEMTRGDWLCAPFSYPTVWNFALLEGNSSGTDLAWTTESSEFNQNGVELAEADNAYQRAEALFKEGNAPRGAGQTQLRFGYLAMLRDDFPQALAHAYRAVEIFEDCGDTFGLWLARTHQVLDQIGAGQFLEGKSIAEGIGQWGAGEGSFSYALGLGLFIGRSGRHWLIRRGDIERSLACYQLAETLYDKLGATINKAKTFVDQGTVYQTIGDRNVALNLYELALDILEKDIQIRPGIQNSASLTMLMLSQQVYLLYQQEMNTAGMERCVGRMETQIASLSLATSLENFALGNMIRSTIQQASVEVPLYKAKQAQANSDPAAAGILFNQAMQAAQAISDSDYYQALVYGYMKNQDKAIAAFQKYLGIGGANAGFVGNLVSLMKTVGGEGGQKEAQIQQRRTAEQAFTFALRIRAYPQAKEYLRQIEEIAGNNWQEVSPRPWLDLSDCGELYEGLGEFTTALKYYDRAINALEQRRQLLSRDELKTAIAADRGVQYLYFQAARTALLAAEKGPQEKPASTYIAEALDYAERGKARSLLDLMVGNKPTPKTKAWNEPSIIAWRQVNAQLTAWQGLLAQARNQYNPDQKKIESLTQQIEGKRKELERIESKLADTNPVFIQSLNLQAVTLKLEDIQKNLPAGSLLLEYYFLGDDFLAWAISPQGEPAYYHARIDAATINKQIKVFNQVCMHQQAADWMALGQLLTETFLAPFSALIHTVSHLVLVPYGAAHTLPFQALPWDGKCLADTHCISILPNASILQFIEQKSGKKYVDSILAVGNPTHMSWRYPLSNEVKVARDLPASELEAVYVASLFKSGKLLTGDQATEKTVVEQLPHYPLVHFATHGILFEEEPMLSDILLADGEAISVYELMGLGLNADLVVLSACQTALGEITGGDDVIGFTRGLLGAGARAAVVSLWPVDDVSTSLFMGEFYRCLRKTRSPSKALQSAQIYLKALDAENLSNQLIEVKNVGQSRHIADGIVDDGTRDYSHPYYWAPFILVGL